MTPREHGGPDANGIAQWDFSSNANACGPFSQVLRALHQVNIAHYPDPAYTQLKRTLAQFHGVEENQLVLAGSASEFVMRLTAHWASEGKQRVWIAPLAYGEYAHAAQVHGLQRVSNWSDADLCWLCDPSSPLGQAVEAHTLHDLATHTGLVVLDRAYEPLRLTGHTPFTQAQLNAAWQLWSPNKALGLTGIRGAYAIAPAHHTELADVLNHKAPSWVLGAHAVEMLTQWVQPSVQAELADSRTTLLAWKTQQMHLLQPWVCLPSQTNFFCIQAQWNHGVLREHGIKLRNTQSFGLLGHWRLSVQPPAAHAALCLALQQGGAS